MNFSRTSPDELRKTHNITKSFYSLVSKANKNTMFGALGRFAKRISAGVHSIANRAHHYGHKVNAQLRKHDLINESQYNEGKNFLGKVKGVGEVAKSSEDFFTTDVKNKM